MGSPESKLKSFARLFGQKYTSETPANKLKEALLAYYEKDGYRSLQHAMRKKPFLFTQRDAELFAEANLKKVLADDPEILKLLNDQDKRVEVHRNLTKAQIIDKLSELHMMAENFDLLRRQDDKKNKQIGLPTLSICIVWIGLYINPDNY